MASVLSKSEVDALKERKRKNTSPRSYALLADGTKVALTSKLIPGAFSGKAGTVKRSKKGRISRAPNGRRFYVRNLDAPKILAYLCKP